MRWWKWVGLAGLAGVAATGAVVARDERNRRAYTPEQIRDRLHERAAGALAAELPTGDPPAGDPHHDEAQPDGPHAGDTQPGGTGR